MIASSQSIPETDPERLKILARRIVEKDAPPLEPGLVKLEDVKEMQYVTRLHRCGLH